MDLLRNLSHPIRVNRRRQRQRRVETAQQGQQFRLHLLTLLFNPGLYQQAKADLFTMQPVMQLRLVSQAIVDDMGKAGSAIAS